MFSHLVPISLCIAFLGAATSAQPPEPKQAQSAAGATGNLDPLWVDLADREAAKAYRAIWALTRTPKETVIYIAGKISPAAEPDARKIKSWIDDLNNSAFSVREKATDELVKLEGLVETELRRALKANPSLETSRRLEKLLDHLQRPLSHPDVLRKVRAVETLELIGAAEARQLLANFATGAPAVRLTRDAKDALMRLATRAMSAAPASPSLVDLYGDAMPPGVIGRLGTIRFRHEDYFLRCLGFVAGGKQLLTLENRSGEIKAWEVASGRLAHALRTELGLVIGFVMAPDGKQFAIPSAGSTPQSSEICVYAFPSGKLVRRFLRKETPFSPLFSHQEMAFSRDGKVLFSLSNSDAILRVEDIASGQELSRMKVNQYATLATLAMALSNDRTYLATVIPYLDFDGKSASRTGKGKLSLWKWQFEKPREFEIANHCPTWIRFSPDGTLLAGVDWDEESRLQVWKVASGKLLYSQACTEPNYFFWNKPAFTPDGKALLLLLQRRDTLLPGKIALLDPATGQLKGVLESAGATGFMGDPFVVSDDSRTLAVEGGCMVRIWDLASRTELRGAEAHEAPPSFLGVSPQGLLVSAAENVRIWDSASSKHMRKLSIDGRVRAMALAPGGKLLALSSADDAVHISDTRTGKEIHRLAGHGRFGDQGALAFLADGRGLLSFGDDWYLRLWDLNTGKVQFEHPIRPEGVRLPDKAELKAEPDALAWIIGPAKPAITRDGKTLVVDVGDYFHLFDTGTGKETFKFPRKPKTRGAMVLSPDSQHMLMVSHDNGTDERDNHFVSLVEVATGKTLQRHVLEGSSLDPVAFSEDGRMFAIGVAGNEILLIETASGKVRGAIRGYRGTVCSLVFFPDGRRLASGMSDSTILIWDLTSLDHLAKGP